MILQSTADIGSHILQCSKKTEMTKCDNEFEEVLGKAFCGKSDDFLCPFEVSLLCSYQVKVKTCIFLSLFKSFCELGTLAHAQLSIFN